MSLENRYTDYDPWAWLYNKSEAHIACQRLLPSLKKLLLPHLPESADSRSLLRYGTVNPTTPDQRISSYWTGWL